MIKKICFRLALVCTAVLCLSACRSQDKQSAKANKPVLYNPASTSLHPHVGVFHVSDSESQLLVMVGTSELIVNEANPEHVPTVFVGIHYQLFDCTEAENNKTISDSASFVNLVPVKPQQKTLVFPITFPSEQGHRYLLSVQVTDLFRHNTIRQFLTVNKKNELSTQNFKLTTLNGTPKLDNYINEHDVFRIIYERRAIDRVFIKYMYAPSPIATSPLAAYPATELPFKADTVWEQAYSPTTNFMFDLEGLYLIQTDTLQAEGLLLMNFGLSYPKEDRTARLVEPIQYLTSHLEYQKLKEAENPKNMMDNFWLTITGSTDKARMLIRVFYTRMSYANQYFTDVKEGWKTDRGMVYMIYGLPNNVLKNSDSEIWEYSWKQHAESVIFTFDRKPTPHSDDHYVLRRGDPKPTYWSRAIDSWRKGQVFSLNELDQ